MRSYFLPLLGLLWTTTIYAQQTPQLYLGIDGINDEAIRCGIHKASIESIVALTLRNNGIRLVAQQTNPFLYVNLNTQHLKVIDRCIYHLQVQVTGWTDFDLSRRPLGDFRARTATHTVFCVQSTLANSRRDDASRHLLIPA
jgi:hypothetical protein